MVEFVVSASNIGSGKLQGKGKTVTTTAQKTQSRQFHHSRGEGDGAKGMPKATVAGRCE